ncbi:hypothetical protein B7P02_02620 [Bordetella bronchiseptica]|nr:hypothetical protein BTL45_02615 [Bordetella bronchiseptica]AWP56940.1 hypothetical protein B7P02_02620 [Bordetella bronchiseptica]AWQ03690.1 hypothetical protein B9G73_02690 [Bordetella bronchiseptica]
MTPRYELDPVRGLRPVCPNCHAMLHRRTPVLSIEALQEILRQASACAAEPGSPDSCEAQ